MPVGIKDGSGLLVRLPHFFGPFIYIIICEITLAGSKKDA